MRTRPRDALWATVAAVFAAAFAWGLLGLVRDLIAEPDPAGFAGLVVGALATALVGRWLIMGAWRRTKWGAPSGGPRDLAERRLAGTGASTGERPSEG